MKNKKISKTKNLRANIVHRLKYVFGKKVEAGKVYKRCIIGNCNLKIDKCESLYYDDKSEALVVYDIAKEQFVLCSGDMAVFKQVLYADDGTICLGDRNGMFSYISKYLNDKGILDVGENDVFNALRNRFYRVPSGLLGILARCYVAVH